MFLLCLLSQKVPHRPVGTLVGGKRDNWDGRKDSGSLPSCLTERPTDYNLMAVDVKADEVITQAGVVWPSATL